MQEALSLLGGDDLSSDLYLTNMEKAPVVFLI